MVKSYFIAVLSVLCCFPAITFAEDMDKEKKEELARTIKVLEPFHKRLGPPGPYDWLVTHHEDGQTFLEYLRSNPVLPTKERDVIYIQPIGEFTKTQHKIIELTAEFLEYYFSLPVKIEEDIPLSVIPASARRKHPAWGMEQILTTYVLEKVLMPNLPNDAASYLAFTTLDLWPGEGWNFVFGQASIENRVGVWSIYRNGNPDKDNFALCLLRTMKTAAHEVGHMFSMKHCIKYECLMCGSNHRKEADRRPLVLCPECVAKVLWVSRADIIKRYELLIDFCRRNNLDLEAGSYNKFINALRTDK